MKSRRIDLHYTDALGVQRAEVFESMSQAIAWLLDNQMVISHVSWFHR